MIDKETLKGMLSGDGYHKLEQYALDSGQNFLTGQVTSNFLKLDSNESFHNTLSATTNVIGGYAVLTNYSGMLASVAEQIVTGTTKVIVEKSAEIVGKAVGDMTKLVTVTAPKMVIEYTMKSFNSNKLSFSDIFAELTKDSEDITEDNDAKIESSTTKNMVSSVNGKISNIQKSIDNVTKDVNKYAKMINSYLTEGPDWVVTQIDRLATSKIEEVQKLADEQTKHIEDDVTKWCKHTGDEQGKKLADKYNTQVKKNALKALSKQKASISKLKSKANSAKQKAILKIMALTGIYLPI